MKDRNQFVKSLTTNMPSAPDHFSRCSAINGKGPALVRELPPLVPLDPESFRKRAGQEDRVVVDVRHYEAFGGQHVPGAYHIDFGGNFATFAGWILPPEKDILLVAESPGQAQEASILLKRVGLDKVAGYLDGGMFAWATRGLPAAHVRQICADELQALVTRGPDFTLVDVRAPREYDANHIDGALNIPVADLRTRHRELDGNKAVVMVCSTGHRSSLGASLLLQHGFKDVANVAGGMTGYGAAGYSGKCPVCVAPHIPSVTGK